MSERTALEIAARLEDSMPICGRAAVIALRRQHAEIERLAAINSTLTEKSNSYVIANARLDEKIDSLTAERDTAIAAAVAAEREACAVVCDGLESLLPGTKTGNMLQWAAYQIRARSAT